MTTPAGMVGKSQEHKRREKTADGFTRLQGLLHEHVYICSPDRIFALFVVSHTCPAPCPHEKSRD